MIKPRLKPVTLRRRLAKYLIQARYSARPGKPLLRLRALGNYARVLATGKPRLRFCDLALTYDCTMSCAHCSASKLEDSQRPVMTVADYAELGRELVENGVVAVQLTGGEPFLRADLEEIIRALGPERLFISVVTNSSLATKQRLESLCRAGLDNLCVSIDDWDACSHDLGRGRPGNHAKALEVLDQALELGLTGMVFHVVTHQNIRSAGLQRLIEHTKRRGVLLVIGWAVPAGNWNANTDVLLTDEDLLYLESIHERYPHVRTDFETNYLDWGCGAGKEKLYITAYGDVMPCAFVHISFGNIFEESLADIRRRAMKIDWFRHYNGRCLAATDREFIDEHLTRVFESAHEPISLAQAGLEQNSTRRKTSRRPSKINRE
jgi:MoaA/NifB/PqqE/SkfB family radical SAM enzyme